MKYIIKGDKPLEGEVKIQGAKNSVLPILAACLTASDKCRIYSCPKLRDVYTTIEILKSLGCEVCETEDGLTVDSSNAFGCEIDERLMRALRSSIVFLGAVTIRMGKAVMSMPGGCALGQRPIDLHLKALRKLGIKIYEEGGFIHTDASEAKCANVHLDFPSVGATENAILTAVKLKGESVITNAAREPEVVDLINFLNSMGAKIHGGGTGTVHIEGVPSLNGTSYSVMPDRIECATFLCAAMATGGEIEMANVNTTHMTAVVNELREEGARIEFFGDRGYIRAPKKIKSASMIKTMPYPGFPTDAQSLFMPHLIRAEGTSVIVENIFENRFNIVNDLNLMGADIVCEGRTAVIRGKRDLTGAHVYAPDLRGGAALLLAGLCAKGETVVTDCGHIVRGYEKIEDKLRNLGADIRVE